tara:strand:- start:579 stop:740 length:162 start_codon:yes stop_codon:yes gene_type:complete
METMEASQTSPASSLAHQAIVQGLIVTVVSILFRNMAGKSISTGMSSCGASAG